VCELTEALVASQLARYSDGVPRVVVAGNHATPFELLRVLDRELPEYKLVTINGQRGLPDREGVLHESPFVGPGVRQSQRLSYLPSRLSLVPALFRTSLPPDVVLLHTSPPRDGVVSLGIEVNVLPAAVEAVRRRGGVVLAQVNPHMPWTAGDALLSTEELDGMFLADRPLAVDTATTGSAAGEAIADRVSRLVGSGATLQAGIGAVPDAVLSAMSRHRRLGVWTEMFSSGVLGLERAGALDTDRPIVASFLFGDADLLAWVDDNPRVRMARTETSNDPARIACQPQMTSINTALQVDLFGQANASWIGGRIYSGLGGQSDFVVGALHSEGGQAVLAVPSWHPKARTSTVVSQLDGPVSSFQHSWIVSECGAAAIWSHPQTCQAHEIIESVAHPSVRARLREEAAVRGLLSSW